MANVVTQAVPGGFVLVLKDAKGKVVGSLQLTNGAPASVTFTKAVTVKSVTATTTGG